MRLLSLGRSQLGLWYSGEKAHCSSPALGYLAGRRRLPPERVRITYASRSISSILAFIAED
jgi:hypothetical protein